VNGRLDDPDIRAQALGAIKEPGTRT